MARRIVRPLAIAALIVAAAVPSWAQEQNRLALGISYTLRLANDEDARAHSGVGIKWRLGRSRAGWGPKFGLGWYATEIERTVDGRQVAFAELKIRPIVGGYGYTYDVSPRLHVVSDVVGGFAIASLELRNPQTAGDVDVSAVLPVVRPEVGVWYDLNRKFGISFSGGYTIARLKLTHLTSDARTTSRLRADAFSISAGIVYKVF